jgi:hypothetical protein
VWVRGRGGVQVKDVLSVAWRMCGVCIRESMECESDKARSVDWRTWWSAS